MNTEVNLTCDRCGNSIHGLIIEELNMPKITGGFYDVAEPSVWREFALTEDEVNVCDHCMWSDPDFIARYPTNRKFPENTTPTPFIPRPQEVVEAKIANTLLRRLPFHKRIAEENRTSLEKEIKIREKQIRENQGNGNQGGGNDKPKKK